MNDELRKYKPKPLDSARLEHIALHYVARYATTRAKLRAYLHRKVRERGWDGKTPPDVETMIEHFVSLGYINDQHFAELRAESLNRRGYGARRVGAALRVLGISEADSETARSASKARAWDAAIIYARRRRIGPFAEKILDPAVRKKNMAAMIRAGHGFEFSRILTESAPGEVPESPIEHY